MHDIIPVILCGGVGSRLWPISRQCLPKQFTSLIDGASLFEAAVRRAARVSKVEPVVVTSSDYRFLAQRQLHGLKTPSKILLEPEGKNTAPAVFAATQFVDNVYGDELILIIPSDHHIPDEKAFANMVESGCAAALDGALVTFGVKPYKPEIGYGYIELGDSTATDCYTVERFIEKPNLEIAKQIFALNNYVWNAGIFLFRASTLLALAQRLEPLMLDFVKASLDCATQDKDFLNIDAGHWSQIEGQSIDYAILERADKIRCLKFTGKWSDLGDWSALANQMPLDGSDNLISGSVSQIDCNTSTLWSDSDRVHLVGLGLKNIVAVSTDDAVLVADASRVQDVRNVVDDLCAKNIPQARQHIRDYRPWGWFESMTIMPGYQVKRLNVYPGAALSLQSHRYRSEHWIVVTGTATVVLDDDLLTIKKDSNVYIQSGQKHRLQNDTDKLLVVIEVQTGSYLGEDDITRYEDDYHRS